MIDIAFFSSPIGLGHATRDIAVVKQLENISVKFTTGKGAADLIKKYGFDVKNVYNPPNFEVQDGFLQSSLRWLWNYYKYYKGCKGIAAGIIEQEKPRLVVSDEDFASLAVAQKKKIPTILLTDILSTRFTTGLSSIIEKKMNDSMKNIMKKCRTVILPQEGVDKENLLYVGPIVRDTIYSREELRKKFSFVKKTIVVSIGGTDAGKFLIKKALESFHKIKDDAELVIVSGPTILKDSQKENIRNFGFVENLHEIIYAADLVISLAGKSTIDESKAYGTPGIFIPIKDHFEQEDNAKAEGYSFEDVYRLDSLILEKLVEKRNPVKCDGAKKAAQIIKKYIA